VHRSPPAPDLAATERLRALATRVGPAVAERVAADGRIPAADVQALVTGHGLAGPDDVLLLALAEAAARADPPVSGYRVGAVGREVPSGDALLAGNIEFPGTDLGRTLHAEGVIAVRSFARGASLATLALTQARPCAHCRQMLSEFTWAANLRIVDPVGHDVRMEDLYPWPFLPASLGESGAAPGSVAWPDLKIADPTVPDDVAALLTETGARAHAPYSRCPAAVVLQLHDGRLVAGGTIESVAFNPTIGPLAAAIAVLRGGGDVYAGIASAYLAARDDGQVDDAAVARPLLAAIAPDVMLRVVPWSR
jgi:cytidine deaminase